MPKALLDDRQVAKAEELRERRAAVKRDCLRWVMDSPKGRYVLADLIADCGVLRAAFVSDALRMAFEQGERNVGVRLMAELIREAPISYRLLEQETAQRVAQHAREDDAAQKDEPSDDR